MFLEPQIKKGWIEVICGSMFSGKTEELIRRLRRAKIANQSVMIFKPKIDTRYDKEKIVSHNSNSIDSIPVGHSNQIIAQCTGADVVGIDEAQFFDQEICDVANKLALSGKRVVVAGLDMDYNAKPFGPIPFLLAQAEYITKLHAICMQCGHLANHSYRKKEMKGQVVLGEMDIYEPRCRICYEAAEDVVALDREKQHMKASRPA